MPKRSLDIEKVVMAQIWTGEIRMRPRIYFVAGSTAAFVGLVLSALCAVFGVTLMSFILMVDLSRGFTLGELASSFPWWVLLVSFLSVFL